MQILTRPHDAHGFQRPQLPLVPGQRWLLDANAATVAKGRGAGPVFRRETLPLMSFSS